LTLRVFRRLGELLKEVGSNPKVCEREDFSSLAVGGLRIPAVATDSLTGVFGNRVVDVVLALKLCVDFYLWEALL
jgi:hypothetical protein